MMNLAVRTKQGFTSRKMPPDLGYVKVFYFTLERNDWVYSCVNFVCVRPKQFSVYLINLILSTHPMVLYPSKMESTRSFSEGHLERMQSSEAHQL